MQEVRTLRDGCRAGSVDRALLSAILAAVDTAAYHFTRTPNFYDLP